MQTNLNMILSSFKCIYKKPFNSNVKDKVQKKI